MSIGEGWDGEMENSTSGWEQAENGRVDSVQLSARAMLRARINHGVGG